MDNKKIFEFIHNGIVTASHTAYISHDLNTFKILENMNAVFLYFSKAAISVPLYTELQILDKFIYIHKIRYGNRFTLNICNDESYKNIFINHLSVIEFLDETLEKLLNKYDDEIKLTLEFNIGSIKSCGIVLNSTNENETFICTL